MRTQSVYLALAIITLLCCKCADAQLGKPATLNEQRVPHLSGAGINVSPGASHPVRAARSTCFELKESTTPPRKITSPQSQIYVIDTAIVRRVWDRMGPGDSTKHLYSFNARAQRISDLTQKLIGELWVDNERQSNTYDAGENILTSLYESFLNGQWVNDHQWTYTYDSSRNTLLDFYEQWSNHSWLNGFRNSYTYDANGNMLSALSEYWKNSQWINSGRSTFSYDTCGNQISNMSETWSNGQWVNSWRYTYTYDANGNMLSALSEPWAQGSWANGVRYTYTHDTHGSVLSLVYEYPSGGRWICSYQLRITYTYDANGNTLSSAQEDSSSGGWGQTLHRTYTYDAFGKLISFRSRNSSTFWNMFYTMSDSAGNTYDYSGYNLTLVWKTVLTAVAPESGNMPASYSLLQNYPNPFNPSTTVTFELPRSSHVSLSVYDVLGRLVSVLVNEKREAGVHEVKFDASGLSSGVYFYRILTGDFVQAKTLVILK